MGKKPNFYNGTQFANVKDWYVQAHARDDWSVEALYINRLLINLCDKGYITRRDVFRALREFDLSQETRDRLIELGEHVIGRLTRRQRREFWKLVDLCFEYNEATNHRLRCAIGQEIEDML